MSRLLPLILMAGCVSEHGKMLATWHGVYEVDRSTRNELSCSDEGVQVEPEHPLLEVATEEGTEADLVDLRNCGSAGSCERVGFFGFVATTATPKRLAGGAATVWFDGIDAASGLCTVSYEEAILARSGPGDPSLSIEIRSAVAVDVVAAGQVECDALLQTMLEDPDRCDALLTMDARRVE